MKILIYSHDFLPVLGGVPIISRILAEGLTEAGHAVVVFTTTLEDDGDAARPYEVVRSTRWTQLLMASRGADVILANGFSRRAGAVGLLTHKPMVIIHQMADKPQDWAHRQSNRLSAFVERRTFATAACHIGVSAACLASKQLDPSLPQAVVYNPVDPEIVTAEAALRSEAGSTKEYDLLFAGRLIDGKGVHVLMDALRQLDAEGYALRVCMAGHGEDEPQLHADSATFDHVVVDFPGALDRAGMARAYASSDTFVIPSSTHLEGMPLVVAEALYFGLPVIGSNQEMIAEGIGDAGLTFESGNANELANHIRLLTDNPALHTDLSNMARARAPLFLPENFLSSILAALHDATQRSHREEAGTSVSWDARSPQALPN